MTKVTMMPYYIGTAEEISNEIKETYKDTPDELLFIPTIWSEHDVRDSIGNLNDINAEIYEKSDLALKNQIVREIMHSCCETFDCNRGMSWSEIEYNATNILSDHFDSTEEGE